MGNTAASVVCAIGVFRCPFGARKVVFLVCANICTELCFASFHGKNWAKKVKVSESIKKERKHLRSIGSKYTIYRGEYILRKDLFKMYFANPLKLGGYCFDFIFGFNVAANDANDRGKRVSTAMPQYI